MKLAIELRPQRLFLDQSFFSYLLSENELKFDTFIFCTGMAIVIVLLRGPRFPPPFPSISSGSTQGTAIIFARRRVELLDERVAENQRLRAGTTALVGRRRISTAWLPGPSAIAASQSG